MKAGALLKLICRRHAEAVMGHLLDRRANWGIPITQFSAGRRCETFLILRSALWTASEKDRRFAGRLIRDRVEEIRQRYQPKATA